MVGIKPIGDKTEWTEEEKEEMYDAIDLKYGDDLYLHTINEDKSSDSFANILHYDVVLLAVQREQICINDELVSLELAEYDPCTRKHLENLPSLLQDDSSDSSDSDWDKEIDVNQQNNWPNMNREREPERKHEHSDLDDFNFDDAFVHFEDEDLMELFPDMVRKKESSTPKPTSELQKIDEVNETEEDFPQQSRSPIDESAKQVDNGYLSAETDATDASSEETVVNHQVEHAYKRPKVDWWQTEEQLILRIGAHDDVQYGLDVTPDHLIYA